MSEERNQYAVVPFDTFERYLGPRYENIPGVEYILENGTLLYFMEEAPGVYESADHTVTGEPAAPKLFVPVYEGDEMQPHAFAEVGPREQFAAITDFSVTIGLPGVNQRKEPGYVLDNGLVLLESERDIQGNYKAGAGMDGMFLQTGRIFEPIRYPDGEILAFLERQPERIRPKNLLPCGSSYVGRRRHGPYLGPMLRKGNGDRDVLTEGGAGNHHPFQRSGGNGQRLYP